LQVDLDAPVGVRRFVRLNITKSTQTIDNAARIYALEAYFP